MDQFIPILVFVTVLFFVQSLFYIYQERKIRAPKRVRQRLKSVMEESDKQQADIGNLLKLRFMSEIPSLHRLMTKFTIFSIMPNNLLEAALQKAPLCDQLCQRDTDEYRRRTDHRQNEYRHFFLTALLS